MKTSTWAARVAAATTDTMPTQVGAIPIVYPLLERLGIRETINELRPSKGSIDLGRLVEVLLLNRLMSPQPLYHVGEWADQVVVTQMFGLRGEQLYDQRFGRTLDELHPWLEEAWIRIATDAVQCENVDLSVSHWDTTSIYLEGAYEYSDLAEYGRSSDGHSGKLQVKLGTGVTSHERVPLLYRLLAGSTDDTTTSVPHFKALAAFVRQSGYTVPDEHPLVVGDCKMITPASVTAAHKYHLYYLGRWEPNNTVNDVIRSVSEAELAAVELNYRPRRHFPADRPFVPYRGVWRSFPVTVDGHTYSDRALVVWSEGKQRLDEDKRKKYLKALLNRLKEIKGYLNKGRYIRYNYAAHQIALAQRGNPAKGLVAVELTGEDRTLSLTFYIDREALAQAQALDGKYLLGTNSPHLSASEALTHFKAQDSVEKSNAYVKGPLQVRPMYLHNDERIEGIVFITLLALLVRSLLELRAHRAGLAYSAEHLLREFAPLYATDQVFIDGSCYSQLGCLTTFQKRVLDSLNFPSPIRYLRRLPDKTPSGSREPPGM